MPTKNPRLNIVLEPTIFLLLKKLAKIEGLSLSLKARDLIREALEEHEDLYWAFEANKREATFDVKKALKHKHVWKN